MTLIVEDGTAIANAESYATAAEATARLSALGNVSWETLTDTQMEEALRRATIWMTQTFRNKWTGQRSTNTQGLDFPRVGVEVDGFLISGTIVPADIKNACIDMALRAAAGPLNADTERTVKSERVGPLAVEYSEHSPVGTRYNEIMSMLSPYISGSSAMIRIERA